MKTESSFDKSRRPCTAARRAPGCRWAVLVAACSLSLGGLAAAADSAWEANWPVPSTSTSAAAVGSAWKADWPVSSTNTSAAEADTQDFERWSRPAFSPEMIDTLRRNAWAGDADAALALTGQLIGRYERGGADDALFEAMVWIDRYQGNERLAKSGLIAHVQQRDCQHKVLRLHWLCDSPE